MSDPRSLQLTRQMFTGFWLMLCLSLLPGSPVAASIDVYEFKDEVTRQRYLAFTEEMRCPKCQNQNLAGSDSPIAADLRRELYELLQDGKSDKEIVDFMVARYGDYVLYRPKVKTNTLLLWGLPSLLLIFGLVMVGLTLRQRRRAQPDSADLAQAEDARLQKLLAAAAERAKRTNSTQR